MSTVRELHLQRGKFKICGDMYLPDEGKGVYPTVILAHGLGTNHDWFFTYGEMLSRAGIACYIFDFCGGCNCSKSDGDMLNMSILTEIKDLTAVLEQIRVQEFVDTNNVFLMGESQGGCVAAMVAAEHPDMVRGLVLLYPGFLIQEVAKERYPDPSKIPFLATMAGMQVGRVYFEDALETDIYGTIGKYTGSVLILHGDRDEVVPISYSERAVSLYQSATLQVVKGAGHGFEGREEQLAREASIAFVQEHVAVPDSE
ncbi:MAG: alpha/beta fold hydrolase [Lachnospiraceae bacterium]|nr:alpha/beta fold hydrolase [Lachnospiraceae bacterium]